MDFNVMIGVVAPFLGTVLGSAMVFLLKKIFRNCRESSTWICRWCYDGS